MLYVAAGVAFGDVGEALETFEGGAEVEAGEEVRGSGCGP